MASELLRERLPPGYSFGVTQDGRVFFIDDQRQQTSWIHPVSGVPVLTGLYSSQGLPKGWEYDTTIDGRPFFIDHHNQSTTFIHPVYRRPLTPEIQQREELDSPEPAHENFQSPPNSPTSPDPANKVKENFKRGSAKQRSVKAPSAKRNPESLVAKQGYIHRLESSGISKSKSWKRRWCVLSDFALFIYKGADEQVILTSILLPSYRINPCTENDGIKRNFVFKVEHENTKTIYLATDDSPELVSWMSLLRQAAMMNGNNSFHREPNNNLRQPVKGMNRSVLDNGSETPAWDNPDMYNRSLNVNPNSRNSYSSHTPSYKGYQDPSASPLNSPQSPPERFSQFQQGSQTGSNRNSLRSDNQSFNKYSTNNSPTYYPSDQGLQTSPRFTNLKDGFAPDSRSSLAQSDSSRGPHNYYPAQAELQARASFLRDSYSDYQETGPRHLQPWDRDFPSADQRPVKHNSFDNLLEPGQENYKSPATFNTRSKSHENFASHPSDRNSGYPRDVSRNNDYDRNGHNFERSPHDTTSNQVRPYASEHFEPNRFNSGNYSRKFSGKPESHHASPRDSLRQQRPHPNHSNSSQFQQPNNAYVQDRRSYTSSVDSRDSRRPASLSYHNQAGRQSSAPPDSRAESPYSQQHSYPRQKKVESQPESRSMQQRHFPANHQQASPKDQTRRHHNTAPSPHINPHTYVNLPNRGAPHQHPNSTFDSSEASPPGRPPYPVAVRQQIVEELAKVQTPVTQQDFLTSAQLNAMRMERPAYFQYPSPRMGDESSPHNRPRNSEWADQRLNQSRASDVSYRQDKKVSPVSPNDSFTRNMNDPEAQKLRVAYERVHSLRMTPERAPPKIKRIHTVKEDPNMSDREVLETNLQKISKKNPLAGPRLRMSISAGDLIGKTHDELVLLLIQLRRNQAALENTRDFYRQVIEKRRPTERMFLKQLQEFGKVDDLTLTREHQTYLESKSQMEEVENKLEVYRPIINLLGNMVTMGSLYGGDNMMLATQYRKHLLRPDQYQPPKKMLEFSRQLQEDRLVKETEEEIRQLSSNEVRLEEKIDRLNELDRLLQEQSFKVSSFKEDKELMKKALVNVLKQQDQTRGNPREMSKLSQQQRTYEKEISRVTLQLAQASKELEETTAESNKLEHEVALLRTKVHGELTRSKSAPSLASENVRTKMNMEKELAKVEGMMHGLNKEGARLSQAMSNIRRSSSSSQLAAALDKDAESTSTYLQTDLDTGDQVDLAQSWNKPPQPQHDASYSLPVHHQRQNAGGPEDWATDEGDENTKRFFGLLPRDKAKGQTVRDVKRQSELRRDKKKDDDYKDEEINLRVSNVDDGEESMVRARVAHNNSAAPNGSEPNHVYENLPRYPSESASASSSRRSSLILMAPKPFTPYQEKRPFRSELNLANPDSKREERNFHSQDMLDRTDEINPYVNEAFHRNKSPENDFFNNQPVSGQFHATPFQAKPANLESSFSSVTNNQNLKTQPNYPWQMDNRESTKDIVLPSHKDKTVDQSGNMPNVWNKQDEQFKSLINAKRKSRNRYLTISSSEPVKLETSSILNSTLHSGAGDLVLNRSMDNVPDIVKSSQTQVDQIDEDLIEREILFMPDKVLIPERYDAEADAEQLTEEEKRKRREKAEKIRKLLTSQSVLSMSQPDVSQVDSHDVHSRVEEEKKARAHFLALNQELARQVTLKTKKQAAERRKTWSGTQWEDIKRQYEEQTKNSPLGSPVRSLDSEKRRAEITMYNM